MLKFKIKPPRRNNIPEDSNYQKSFSLALMNWETNRQEDKFSFSQLEVSRVATGKRSWSR